MGAILAAVIVMAVMGASLSLLHAHLEGVDEYNRRAAEVADAHRRAVHESVGVSAEPSDGGSYTVNVANERADPVEIIEVRSVLENGTAARLPEFGGTISLAGFGEASVGYDVPEGATGTVRILAVTRMGNTFGAEIGAQGKGPDATRATVNGMGIGSRLAQAEYSGHVIYGSDSWGSISSLRPHVGVDGGASAAPPSFAALLLDSDAESSVAISGYDAGTLITLGADGTLSSSEKPSLLALTESRGGPAASDAGEITVYGTGQAMIRLDPAMFGKRVLLNATLGGGRVEMLTSPHGSLATPVDIAQVRAKCPGLTWMSKQNYVYADTTEIIASNGWPIDLRGFGAYLIYSGPAPELELTPHTVTRSKSGTIEDRNIHIHYWSLVHRMPTTVSGHATQIGLSEHLALRDYHRNFLHGSNTFLYGFHHGEFSVQYNSTSLQMPGSGLLLRDGSRAHVAYGPAMSSKLLVSQASPPNSRLHAVNDDTPVPIIKRWVSHSKLGIFLVFSTWTQTHYPHIIVSAAGEPSLVTRDVGDSQYKGGDQFFGIPIMSFREGTSGNDDYVSLAEVTFNAIDPRQTILTHVTNNPRYPPYWTFARVAWDNSFCVIADRPYVSERTFASDTVATTVVVPERDQHARHLYLLVTTRAGPVTLSAVSGDSIGGLTPSVPYVMELDGRALHSGITTERGTIPFVDGLPGSFTLRLYPDSASYRGAFSTVVFDPRAGESVRVAGEGDSVYTVHTWAQVPVTGTVTVSDVEVRTRDGTGLRLEYLDGEYSAGAGDGGRIWVPVIPGHFSIHMRINGVDAALRYSDALGGSNVRVIPASTSTVSRASVDGPIQSICASAGTSAYAIASSDLPIVAIISSTMSGTAYIEHEHAARTVRTCVRDPLTGWITAYKNGELVYESNRIVDYNPAITRSSTVNGEGFGVTRATFQYDRVAIDETVVVNDVSVGDFVEFHVHANIYAEHPFASATFRSWCGWGTTTVHVSSEASATANIHGGSIIVG